MSLIIAHRGLSALHSRNGSVVCCHLSVVDDVRRNLESWYPRLLLSPMQRGTSVCCCGAVTGHLLRVGSTRSMAVYEGVTAGHGRRLEGNDTPSWSWIISEVSIGEDLIRGDLATWKNPGTAGCYGANGQEFAG